MRPIPEIPGWRVVEDDGVFVATRRVKVTRYQRWFGGINEVDARTETELRILCDAQTRLGERLAKADQLRPKISPHPKALKYWQEHSDTEEMDHREYDK